MYDTLAVMKVPVFSTICNEAFRLRRAVFVVEQQVPEEEEFDPYDLLATHVVAITSGEVCGTLRVIHDPEHIKIGRVVVAIAARGSGVASAMIAYAMAQQPAGSRYYLTAQRDKTALYEKFGFRAFGDVFPDGGIPHVAMKTY